MIDSHENEDKEHHQDWEGEKAINGHWPLSYIRIRKKERGSTQVGRPQISQGSIRQLRSWTALPAKYRKREVIRQLFFSGLAPSDIFIYFFGSSTLLFSILLSPCCVTQELERRLS